MYYPGTILLAAATVLGIFSTVAFACATRREQPWLERGRQAFILMTGAVVLASATLMYLIIKHDYRLAYVWSYSDNSLPMSYLASSFWAGQEGSFLLWVLCGVGFGIPLMRSGRQYESRVMFFYNLTLVSLMLLLLKQNPFRFHEGLTAASIPIDGAGLNPILQNPWMVIHPPVMFIGYASLAVPFAFAMAALWMRRYEEWIKVSLPWVLISLFTLGAAIMMGGYWAYETLGWGGYWGWDPVENASLVPWLLTAALGHGMLLQLGSKRFRRLNLVLAVLSYLMVIYATFLTRSGVLSDFSVHSFVDLGITGYLVFDMLFFLIMSLGLLGWRWREIPTEVGKESFLTRTIFIVLGTITLGMTTLVIAVGTSAPLITRLPAIAEASGGPQSLDPSFYTATDKPTCFYLAIILALILGTVPFLTWNRIKEGARNRLLICLAIIAAALAISFGLGLRRPLAYLYLGSALLVVVANAWALADKLRSRRFGNSGAALSHIGIGVMLIGFLTTGWLGEQSKVRLIQDAPTDLLGYTLTFLGPETNPQGRDEMQVEVTSGDSNPVVLKPLMWINQKSNQLVANPDIRSRLTSDLYLAPSEYNPQKVENGSTVIAKKNQATMYEGWSILLTGFDTSAHDAGTGGISVASKLTLQGPGQEPIELQAMYVIRGGGEPRGEPCPIPGTAATVEVQGIDADNGLVKLAITGLGSDRSESAGTPASLVLDVSTKPLILLVWLGTILTLSGSCLAAVRRWRAVR